MNNPRVTIKGINEWAEWADSFKWFVELFGKHKSMHVFDLVREAIKENNATINRLQCANVLFIDHMHYTQIVAYLRSCLTTLAYAYEINYQGDKMEEVAEFICTMDKMEDMDIPAYLDTDYVHVNQTIIEGKAREVFATYDRREVPTWLSQSRGALEGHCLFSDAIDTIAGTIGEDCINLPFPDAEVCFAAKKIVLIKFLEKELLTAEHAEIHQMEKKANEMGN